MTNFNYSRHSFTKDIKTKIIFLQNKNPLGIFNPPAGEGKQNPAEGNEIP